MMANSIRKVRWVCCTTAALLILAVTATAQAQVSRPVHYVLQDNDPSPSDLISIQQQDAQASTQGDTGPVVVSPVDPSQGSQATRQTAPAPNVQAEAQDSTTSSGAPEATAPVRPNVTNFGDFNQLTRSGVYASPIALSLGAGGSGASSTTSAYFGTAAHRNLLDTPEMFGDFRRPGSSLVFDPSYGIYPPYDGSDHAGIDFPSAGSFSGMRVSENNVALPQDRIWTSYHHMHNAFQLPSGDLSLDRFIFGFEKTFCGGSSSVEFRLPIAGSLNPMDPSGNTSFAGGSFGNLGIIYKRVLIANSDRVIAAGLRVETPTGSKWHSSDTSNGSASFTLDPHAVYVTPYIGTLREINDIWFINSFFQVDIATGGDRLYASLGGNQAQEFRINQPPLLQIDLGGGVWLVTPDRNTIGVAAISELHLAHALADDDSFAVDPALGVPNVVVDQNPIRNIVNATNGFHFQLNDQCSVRTAISVPLLSDRVFDTEFMVQVNRNY